jgi:hypothetical protein
MRNALRAALLVATLPCLFGQIAPKMLAPDDWGGCCLGVPRELTADATTLYWEQGQMEGPFSQTPYIEPSIRSMSKAGGAVNTVALVKGYTNYLTRCDGGFCWSQSESIFYLPDGGVVKTLATAKNEIEWLGADAKSLYWLERGTGAIRRLEVKGGKPQDVIANQAWPVVAGRPAGSLTLAMAWWLGARPAAMDSSNLYVFEIADQSYLVGIPKSGGLPKRLAPLPRETRTVIDVIADDSYIYWLRLPPRPRIYEHKDWSGEIQRVPKSGGAPTTIVALSETPVRMAKAGSRIAFLTSTGAVKIARDNRVPLVLFPGPHASELAADDKAVYWIDYHSKKAGIWTAPIPGAPR